jgi:hypothetical protein
MLKDPDPEQAELWKETNGRQTTPQKGAHRGKGAHVQNKSTAFESAPLLPHLTCRHFVSLCLSCCRALPVSDLLLCV